MLATGLLLVQFETSSGQAADGAARLQLAALLAGTFLLIGGLRPIVRTHRWNARAYRATGHVVDHVCLGGRHQKIYAPIVEFDVGETHVRFLGSDTAPDDRPVGARVPVLYDPNDPGQARLAGFKTVPSWWLIAGLAVVAIGVVVI